MVSSGEMPDSKGVEEVEARVWASLAGVTAVEPLFDSKGTFAATALFADLAHPLISRVVGLGSGRTVEPETLDRIIERYDATGADSIFVPLAPTARPAKLPRLLKERGFEASMKEAKLYRTTEQSPQRDPYFQIREASPEELEVVQVLYANSGMRKEWTNIVSANVGAPYWYHYMALDGGRPVALGSMYAWQDYAFTLPGWTLPAYRRKGFQRAINTYRIGEAKRLGCGWITANVDVTEAPIGFTVRSYERLGFKILYLRDTYIRQRPPSALNAYTRRMMATPEPIAPVS